MSLRNLTRFRSYLISSVDDLKRKTITALDQVFQEYASFFSNIFKEILISISTPQDFENITADKLEKVLKNIIKRNFFKENTI